MQLRTSERKSAKIRLSLQGPPGSGKSMSALLLAYGLVNNWQRIAVIDTERGSADMYAHLGNYYVLPLTEPFTPERYIEAITLCEKSGMECIIIDSISHEWSGKGGCLEIHDQVTSKMKIPNSFTAWNSVSPLHQNFIDAILQSTCHVITTIRTKTEYVISERNGKQVPQKVGMAAVQRDGYEYEVSISLELDDEHFAISSKDRTGLFSNKGKFQITVETGKLIRNWTNSATSSDSVKEMVKASTTIERLNELYKSYPEFIQQLNPDFTKRKQEIISENIRNNQNFGKNGTQISPV